MMLIIFLIAYLAFMGGYEAGWYVARGKERPHSM